MNLLTCVQLHMLVYLFGTDNQLPFYSPVARDLTAQNILISERNTAKVSNFELARDATFNLAGCMLPIKWTAPEAISNGVSGFVDVE